MANVINSLKLGDGTYVFTTPYATCDTAAATAAKVATITPGSNFSLETGARVAVKFTYAHQSGTAPTLNVNSTGAKAIYFKNAALAVSNYWSAGQIVDFIYDGTNWVCSAVVTDNNTHYASNLVSTNSSSGLTNAAADPTSGAGYLYLNLIENSIVRNSHKIVGSGLTKVTSNASGDITIKSSLSSWDTSDKIFLIGATSQSTDVSSTYSHDTAYVGTDGCLYSNSKKVATVGDNNTFTGDNTFKGGTTLFLTASAGLNDSKTSVAASGVLCQTGGNVGTYYKDGKITNGTSTLTLPSISGTIALKSDISSIGTFDDSIDIWDTTYSGDKYVSIEAAGSGSICVHNDDDNTLLTLNFPAITDGTYTLATTSDIPSASNFVTVANEQTISGKKTFTGGAQFGTNTVFNNGGIQIPAANAFKVMGMYDVSLPSKSGTLATTSDIKIKSASLSGTTLSITLS